MKWNQKLKAGALQFVLFIGAIIAVLLMSFVLISHSHNVFHQKTDVLVGVINASEAGIMSYLQNRSPLGINTTVDDKTKLGATLSLERNYWGVFEKRTATAQFGNTSFTKTALVGQSKEERRALFLKDNLRPLIVAGDAEIIGNAYLPEQGIKMGNIYGNAYHRSKLVYGEQKKSTSTLPKIDFELGQQLTILQADDYEPEADEVSYVPNMDLKNSFANTIKLLKGNIIRLEGAKLAGNIMVIASQRIIVEQNSLLQDVILLAPEIIIKDWVKGHFQAIASKHISIGKKCQLAYPTALIVKNKTGVQVGKKAILPNIYLDSYAEVKGVVAYISDGTTSKASSQISIDYNAKIHGEVYCSENLELKGRVSGTISTNAFIAMENGSVYMNHMYDGKINGTTLEPSYAGLLTQQQTPSKKVMKWLY